MLRFLGNVVLAYLAGTGVVTAAAVMGKGMVRAARKAVAGNLHDAGVEALGALALPVAMSYAAMSSWSCRAGTLHKRFRMWEAVLAGRRNKGLQEGHRGRGEVRDPS